MNIHKKDIKEIVKEKYSQIAIQTRKENETSCCGSGGCGDVDYTIFSENYEKLDGYNPDADLALGAGVGTGIFISIITRSTPLAIEEWSLSNLVTGKSLISIASHGGPRCCKRDVYLSILESIQFLKEKFDVKLDSSEVNCQFSDNNKECLKSTCLFYPMS
jgi:hypothetical protein